MDKRPASHASRCVVALLGIATLLLGPPSAAESATTETKQFATFENAWRTGNHSALVGCMEAEGKLTLLLLRKPFKGKAGSYNKAQAVKALEDYFKDIHNPTLKDVTPDDQRKKNPSVRIYDYTYRPTKGNKLTTRLEVRLKRTGSGAKTHWVLDSLSERVRKP